MMAGDAKCLVVELIHDLRRCTKEIRKIMLLGIPSAAIWI
jgi:hypothetical protein